MAEGKGLTLLGRVVISADTEFWTAAMCCFVNGIGMGLGCGLAVVILVVAVTLLGVKL